MLEPVTITFEPQTEQGWDSYDGSPTTRRRACHTRILVTRESSGTERS